MPRRFWVLAIAVVLHGCSVEESDGISGDDDSTTSAPDSDEDEDGWSIEDGDCDDQDESIYPESAEIAHDGIDQDCDGDDLLDGDGDGYDADFAGGDDCNDDDFYVHPGAGDIPYDGIDQNCDGEDPTDLDGDGYDSVNAGGDDCADLDDTIHPGAEELCDGLDTDCDGSVPIDEIDVDQDGQRACEGDCDDFDPVTGLGFPEECDGLDNDCDGSADGELVDADGDGELPCEGDCDDNDPEKHTGALEFSCDGIDSDCDGATEFVVPDDYAVIQDALNASTDGGEICVGPGTYQENLTIPPIGIRMTGTQGAEETIIDGMGAGSVITLIGPDSGDPTLLSGLTLTNGNSGYGGGLFVQESSPTLQNLIISQSEATWRGGGLYFEEAAPNLADIVIQDNTAGMYGGGLYGCDCDSSELLLSNIEVRDNVANENGGIHLENCWVSLSDVSAVANSGTGIHVRYGGPVSMHRFTSTENTYYGVVIEQLSGLEVSDFVVSDNVVSGLLVREIYSSPCIVTNGVISGNGVAAVESGQVGGGGMGTNYSYSLEMSNLLIIGNSSTYDGGGLDVSAGSDAHLSNSIILGNSAGDEGGGIRFGSIYGHGSTYLTLTNVAIVGNNSDGWYGGGGIAVGSSGVLAVSNTIVYANTAAQDGGGVLEYFKGGAPSFLHCNIFGNFPDEVYGFSDPTGSDGNVSVEPFFLDHDNQDPWGWDLHLQAASVLIDAGDTTIVDPDGTTSDIGAYGGPEAGLWDLDWDGYPAWWQPGPYDHANYPGGGWDCDDLDPDVLPGAGC